jgi:hypothetical protein
MGRKTRTIDVIAADDGNGGVCFHMEENGKAVEKCGKKKDVERLVFSKTAEKMKKEDVHELLFKLQNKKGANVRFPTNRLNAMWVHKVADEDGPCPDDQKHLPGEFYAEEVSENQDRLTVINENMEPCLVAFRLNFVPAGEDGNGWAADEYIVYDPIGSNQNGPER